MRLDIAARKYLKAEFRHQGRLPKFMDCAGLLVLSAQDEGVELEDLKGYGRTPNSNQLQQQLEKQFTRVTDMHNGDVLLMKFRNEPQHIAIKNELGIIHCFNGYGCVEHILDDRWKKRIIAVYRYE